MSALSFTSAVAVRPVAVANAAKASVSTRTVALGGFGPNMPVDEYKKKMEAKNALIAANKAKGAAKTGGFFFGKKAAAPAPAAKTGGFSLFTKKEATLVAAKKSVTKKDTKPAALSSFGAGLPNRRKTVAAAAPAAKKGFSLFGK